KKVVIKNGMYISGEFKDGVVESGDVRLPSNQNTLQFQNKTNSKPSNQFSTTMIAGDDIRPILEDNKVEFDARIEENWMNGLLSWLLPIGLIVVFWLFIFKRMNPGQQVLNIGK